MYILFESKQWEDKRVEHFGKHWFYIIGYIKPEDEESVDLTPFDCTIISSAVAHADLLVTAVDGKTVIAKGAMKEVMTRSDMVYPTSYGDNDFAKDYYFLTDDDTYNACTLLKEIMLLQIKGHGHRKDQEALRQLIKALDDLPMDNLNNVQMFMSTYFEYETPHTQFAKKNPTINIKFKFDGEGF